MEVYEAAPEGFTENLALVGVPKGANSHNERRRKIKYNGPEALMQRMLAFLEDDEYLSLAQEIALARSILDAALLSLQRWEQQCQDMIENGPILDETTGKPMPLPKPPVTPAALFDALQKISKLVEREHNMRYNDANLITTDSAVAFALGFATLVNQFVKNEEEREAVIEGTRKLLAAGRSFDLDFKVVKKIFGVSNED